MPSAGSWGSALGSRRRPPARRFGGASSLGPLHGVPIAVKDNIGVAGDPLTAATPQLEGHVAEHNSHVAERLGRAGAILLGRTNMASWAIGGTSQNAYYGTVANPWDPERIAGGSSGGSGAAVAAGMVPAALGTDTGGSIRIPACLTGLCGLRSTVGRVSNAGTIPVAWSFDVVGPIARTARDAARLLAVIAGYDPATPSRRTGRPRITRVSSSAGSTGSGSCVSAAISASAPTRQSTRRSTSLRRRWRASAQPWRRPSCRASRRRSNGPRSCCSPRRRRTTASRLRNDPDGFQPDVRARLEQGARVSGPGYAIGRREQRRWRRLLLEALGDCDVLLAPACPIEAPRIADSDPERTTGELAACLTPFVLVQLPALTVPCGFGPHGLPLGMQLVGRPFAEATLLRTAHAYQEATDWHLRRPPSS